MKGFPIITVLTLVPLIGGVIVAGISQENKKFARGLSLTFSFLSLALTLVVFAVYGLAASFFRRHLVERPSVTRRIQKGFALGYVGIGGGLATTHR